MRHVKVGSMGRIERELYVDWVQEAVALTKVDRGAAWGVLRCPKPESTE